MQGDVRLPARIGRLLQGKRPWSQTCKQTRCRVSPTRAEPTLDGGEDTRHRGWLRRRNGQIDDDDGVPIFADAPGRLVDRRRLAESTVAVHEKTSAGVAETRSNPLDLGPAIAEPGALGMVRDDT